MLTSVTCLSVPYFLHILIKGTIFIKMFIENKMRVLIYSTNLSETFLILRKIQRDNIINVHKSSCNVTFTFVRFDCNLSFLNKFSKNPQISNFMKIRPMGTNLFHADRRRLQADRHDEVNSRFSRFCEMRLKNTSSNKQ